MKRVLIFCLLFLGLCGNVFAGNKRNSEMPMFVELVVPVHTIPDGIVECPYNFSSSVSEGCYLLSGKGVPLGTSYRDTVKILLGREDFTIISVTYLESKAIIAYRYN